MIVLKKAINIRHNGKTYEATAGEEVDVAEVFDIDAREADCLETRYISKFPKDVVRLGNDSSEQDDDESRVDEGAEKTIESLTKDEIIEQLIERDVDHDPRDKKDTLLALLRQDIEDKSQGEG